MKLLVVASTLDLKFRLGCTPSWWMLLKAFHEEGHEVVAIPYLGDPVESLWWRTHANPTSAESRMFLKVSKSSKNSLNGKAGLSKKVADTLIARHIRPKWKKHLHGVLKKEKDVDAVFMMNAPVNHFTGIPTSLRDEFGVKVAYYDGDMPTILPKYAVGRGFKFSYYDNADLSEYDAFFSNSKGVIPDLQAMGAKKVQPLYWAADPDLFKPVEGVPQDYDVAFYGYGSQFREEWMTNLITKPSRAMTSTKFVVGGGGFGIDLGKVQEVGDIPYAGFGRFVAQAKINLNTTRHSHTSVYASATSRPFELAAYGACIVSQPYNGIEEWFDVGKDLVVVRSAEEAIETYQRLLKDEGERVAMMRSARQTMLKRHTFRHRAREVVGALA